MGIGMVPSFAADGLRTTSASANLRDKPSNLHIWTEATVRKIISVDAHAVAVETTDGRKGNLTLRLYFEITELG
jgi:hypothetical protein